MESFTVKFLLLQSDGYWKQCEETFQGKRKDSHKEAEAACLKKYGNASVQINCVIYQGGIKEYLGKEELCILILYGK